MTRDVGRLRAAMATLLVASAVLFGIGILIERGTGSAGTPHVEATSPPAAASTAPHVKGSGEAGGEGGSTPAAEAPTATGEAGETAGAHPETFGSEAILGIDPEAPALVTLAIILSLLAAVLVWRDGRRLVMAGAVAVALGFAALDLLEVSHQFRDGTTLLVLIAGLVAVGHLLAAALGVSIYRRPETR
jgi:hypothetical protein